MANSRFVSSLNPEELRDLRSKFHRIQQGKCYICQGAIDLTVHDGALDIDHIEPLATGGRDIEQNLALTHSSCNRSKGASHLRVARSLHQLKALELAATARGERGANLDDILSAYGGSQHLFRLERDSSAVKFSFSQTGDNATYSAPLYEDMLSKQKYFFCLVPLEYLHHDDVINPRSIGSSIRGLLEEFLKGRPQLHVGLAWWTPEGSEPHKLRLFDGQHKAAAQILLGATRLPVRVFVEPDVSELIQTNTNAGSTLRQVAFDKAVMRHLGSSLYGDRIRQYQRAFKLEEDDYSFSEREVVQHFRGEKRQMERFIIDAQRDAIAREAGNRLLEFVEWSGKVADRPLAYSTVDSAFFQLLHRKALANPIGQGSEREIERRQMVRLMNLFAQVFFVDQWDGDLGGRRLESRIQKGERFPEGHVRAWRIAREEVAVNVLRWVRSVIENYYAVTGRHVERERLFLEEFPEPLWDNVERFLKSLAALPCWVNPQLASVVFGPKQNQDFWEAIFRTGKAPTGMEVLPGGLDLQEMITPR